MRVAVLCSVVMFVATIWSEATAVIPPKKICLVGSVENIRVFNTTEEPNEVCSVLYCPSFMKTNLGLYGDLVYVFGWKNAVPGNNVIRR